VDKNFGVNETFGVDKTFRVDKTFGVEPVLAIVQEEPSNTSGIWCMP
jgi:hypothetical protein